MAAISSYCEWHGSVAVAGVTADCSRRCDASQRDERLRGLELRTRKPPASEPGRLASSHARPRSRYEVGVPRV